MSAVLDIAAAERGHVYELLCAVFRRPLDARRLERLRAPQMLAAFRAAGIDPGENFARDSTQTLLDRLAIDYTQLFHGPGGRIAPYESIQTGDGPDLMGEAARDVRRFMAEVGFTVAPESGELPDHISVELAFMAELVRRETEAAHAGDAATAAFAASLQRRFLAEHLGRWAGPFAHKVKARATTPFYAAMADLLAGFIDDEKTELAIHEGSHTARPKDSTAAVNIAPGEAS